MDDFSDFSKKLDRNQPIRAEDRKKIQRHINNFKTLREKMITDLEDTLRIQNLFSRPRYADIFILSAWMLSVILSFYLGFIYS